MLTVGIVGTNFVSEWFVAAARRCSEVVQPVAVCSRSIDTAREFAAEHDLGHAFDDLVSMCEVVDIVYIASPISAHHEQALAAIDAGCHVLVEKAMTSTLAETEEIFAAAEARGVIAMEAMRNIHTAAHEAIRDALPRLGSIRYAHLEKCQYSSRYDKFRAGIVTNAFNPELGNSAVADMGVYPLQPTLELFGVPSSTSGTSVRLENGFDAAGTMLLTYEGFKVDVVYSKITGARGPNIIQGEDGTLEIDDIAETSRIVLRSKGAEPETILETAPVAPADTMHHQIRHFAEQVDAGRIDPRWRDVTIATRRLLDEHLARQPLS